MATIPEALHRARERIAAACAAVGRDPREVVLLAVGKTRGPDALRAACAAGVRAFGENYLQEAVAKIDALADLAGRVEWHFIGPLQANKTRAVAERFDWVHSVDRAKVAERLAAQRPPKLAPLQVCVQVNVSGEATKGGVAPAEAAALARAVAALPRLRLRGLMAIPAPTADRAAQRAPYRALRELLDALNADADGLALDTLSIGMSDDLEAAIAEGATIVRLGTAIFGARPAPR